MSNTTSLSLKLHWSSRRALTGWVIPFLPPHSSADPDSKSSCTLGAELVNLLIIVIFKSSNLFSPVALNFRCCFRCSMWGGGVCRDRESFFKFRENWVRKNKCFVWGHDKAVSGWHAVATWELKWAVQNICVDIISLPFIQFVPCHNMSTIPLKYEPLCCEYLEIIVVIFPLKEDDVNDQLHYVCAC